ncbi:carboxypeptidase-like regulatory domain-containing protein [Seonamhaeicola marinus]|uniref:Carboxypeptidase-like regulatory domain-containing protein n=1 Tax=Seonamhaeicola marinus TaxID=1912246 RepID=A0A5D0I4Z9_9FLAO|nr:carboxypeptidase-like regulatory domain-containing protein [Seonamhaeicola marinus]TYA78776.1 carboxypeptidase-like regulatory domain-containing protein [Seonamhaeicola marinus]
MSKKIISLLNLFVLTIVLSISTITNAQSKKIEVSGTILDESNNPVPFVAVGIVKKYIGTASTEDGEFSFLITNSELQDSLSISSLGYDPFKIKVADYLKLEKKEIILKETVTELDAIKLLSPNQYVENALKFLKENTVSQPHKIELLYRRAATESGKSKFFVENYIKIRDKGPAYPLGMIEVAQVRKSADYRVWKRKQWTHSINYMGTGNPLRPSERQPNFKKFTWKKIGDSSYEGEDVVILEGTNNKNKWQKYKLYIGVDNYGVYKIETGKTIYLYKKHSNGKLYLSYHAKEWGWSAKNNNSQIPREYWNTEAREISYRSEAFVYKIETDKKKARVRPFGGETDMGSIDVPYDANFWKNLSMPPDTEFYKKIKSELESNYGVSLEKQYQLVNK